jgi:hypothetical protein
MAAQRCKLHLRHLSCVGAECEKAPALHPAQAVPKLVLNGSRLNQLVKDGVVALRQADDPGNIGAENRGFRRAVVAITVCFVAPGRKSSKLVNVGFVGNQCLEGGQSWLWFKWKLVPPLGGQSWLHGRLLLTIVV